MKPVSLSEVLHVCTKYSSISGKALFSPSAKQDRKLKRHFWKSTPKRGIWGNRTIGMLARRSGDGSRKGGVGGTLEWLMIMCRAVVQEQRIDPPRLHQKTASLGHFLLDLMKTEGARHMRRGCARNGITPRSFPWYRTYPNSSQPSWSVVVSIMGVRLIYSRSNVYDFHLLRYSTFGK